MIHPYIHKRMTPYRGVKIVAGHGPQKRPTLAITWGWQTLIFTLSTKGDSE